jgi:hypothetical protein
VRWENLKHQIENHLLQDTQAFVTLFIDYYGIPENYHYPGWQVAHLIADKNQRMQALETAMHQSISGNINHRFIPYLQLHEFEGLLFNNIEVFTTHIPMEEFNNLAELAQTIQNNPNPEMINNTPNNAPSYRLKRLIKGYNKIVYGSILAKEIGLDRIRTKSPRFNEWIEKLERIYY